MQGFSEYDGPLQHDVGQPDVVVMTRLQIAMSREIGGWPLYTIVIGLGQVRHTNQPIVILV
jgi:alpha-1,3-glucan synthase